jgi:hypothetical protein
LWPLIKCYPSAEFYEYQTVLSTSRFRCILGYFFKNQSGKIRNMNGKRSASFPTDVCRTAPNLTPWSLRKNKTIHVSNLPWLVFKKISQYTPESRRWQHRLIFIKLCWICWTLNPILKRVWIL